MAGKLLVHFDSPETAAQLVTRFSRASATKRTVVRELQNFLNGLQGGVRRAHVRVQIFGAFASQTVTCDRDGAVDDTDTITIGTITLAVKAAPANENQFAKGANDAAMATNLAAAINAHSVLSLFLKASAAADVVTITCLLGGPVGDAIKLAEVGNGMALTGANLTGGDQAVDEGQTFVFGFSG